MSIFLPRPPPIPADTNFKTSRIQNLQPDFTTGKYTTWLLSALVATTTENITLVGTEEPIDDITVVPGDKVLVKNQTDPVENGLYIVTDQQWYRSQDLTKGTHAAAVSVFVKEGTINKDNLYICTNDEDEDLVGLDSLTFTAVAGSNQVTPLTESHIFVGNASNVATDVALSGAATLSGTGVLTLANSGVTAGSYTSVNLTVNQKGLITAASNSSDTSYEIVTTTGSTLSLNNTSILRPTPPVISGTYNFPSNSVVITNAAQVSDSFNNIFVTGTYSTSTHYNISNRDGTQSTLSFPATTSTAIFVIKYSSEGQAISYTVIDTDGTSTGQTITIDSQDNIYVGGIYESSLASPVYNFTTDNNLSATSFQLPSVTVPVGFIIKFSSSGASLLWTIVEGDTSTAITSLTTDTSDNLYVALNYTSPTDTPIYDFSSTNTLGPGTTFSISADTGTQSGAIIQWDSAGIPTRWTSILAGTSSASTSIRVDSLNSIYVTGTYVSGTTVPIYDLSTNSTIGPGTQFSLPVNAGPNAYLIKWSEAGQASLWTILQASAVLDITSTTLVIDSENSVYMGGTYRSTSAMTVYNLSSTNTIGPGTQFSIPANSPDTYGFIVKWNISGIASSWTMILTTTTSTVTSIAIDSVDNVYAAGAYSSISAVPIYNFTTTSTLGPTSAFAMVARIGSSNAYIVKWSSLGIARIWTTLVSLGTNSVTSILLDSSDCINTTNSSTTSTVTVNNFSTVNSQTSRITLSASNTFLLKWLNTGVLDLGIYTTPINFILPTGVLGTPLEKKILLVTTNYQYLFKFQGGIVYSISVTGAFGNKGIFLNAVWSGSEWTLTH